MAVTEVLAGVVLDSISAQIGKRIQQLASLPREYEGAGIVDIKRAVAEHSVNGLQPLLCESLQLWMLDTYRLAQQGGDGDIRVLSYFTGRWHHQIRLPSGGMAYARSMAIEVNEVKSNWSVRELYEGGLARKIDAVLDIVDRQFSDDFVVRLLSIRAYQINALWILNEHTGDQSVLVVTTARGPNALQTGVVYSSRDFLNVLRRMPIVNGLTNESEMPFLNSPLNRSRLNRQWNIDVKIRFRQFGSDNS